MSSMTKNHQLSKADILFPFKLLHIASRNIYNNSIIIEKKPALFKIKSVYARASEADKFLQHNSLCCRRNVPGAWGLRGLSNLSCSLLPPAAASSKPEAPWSELGGWSQQEFVSDPGRAVPWKPGGCSETNLYWAPEGNTEFWAFLHRVSWVCRNQWMEVLESDKKAEASLWSATPISSDWIRGVTCWCCWAWGVTSSLARTDVRAVGTSPSSDRAAWGPFFCHLPLPRSILIDDLKMQWIASPGQKNNLIKQLVADTLQISPVTKLYAQLSLLQEQEHEQSNNR